MLCSYTHLDFAQRCRVTDSLSLSVSLSVSLSLSLSLSVSLSLSLSLSLSRSRRIPVCCERGAVLLRILSSVSLSGIYLGKAQRTLARTYSVQMDTSARAIHPTHAHMAQLALNNFGPIVPPTHNALHTLFSTLQRIR